MKGKHAKNTANKQKLAKRMLALCFAVVFLCSCVLPVFATGSSLLTDALREAVEETAASTDTSTEAGGGTMMDDFQSMVSSSEYKTTYRFWLSEKDSYDLPDAAKTSASDLEGYDDFYAVAAIVNNTTLTAPEGFQNPTDPTGEGRTFEGWSYIDTYGLTQTFTFDDSPVLLDKSATIDVFAQWGEAPAEDPATEEPKDEKTTEEDTKTEETPDGETVEKDQEKTEEEKKITKDDSVPPYPLEDGEATADDEIMTASLYDGMISVMAATDPDYTVSVGKTVDVKGKAGDYDYYRYHGWSSSDESIATVSKTGTGKNATVTGKKAGTVTLTHSYWVWIGWNDWKETSEKFTVTVTGEVTIEDEPATVFVLLSPKSDRDSNSTSEWGYGIPGAKINMTGAAWDGKNVKQNVSSYILNWPQNMHSETIKNGNDYVLAWDMPLATIGYSYAGANNYQDTELMIDQIWSKWSEEIKKDIGDNDLTKGDITHIYIIPYKISKDNGTSGEANTEGFITSKHIDCEIRVICSKVFLAKFHVEDAGETEYTQISAKNYKITNNVRDNVLENNGEDYKTNYPATKTVNGVEYVFDGWYNEDGVKVNDWTNYVPTDEELEGDNIVNFYAHYVRATTEFTIQKKVTGNMADLEEHFEFTVSVMDSENNPLSFELDGREYPDGTADFRLSDGDSVKLTDVPVGAIVTITEKNADGYTVNAKLNGATVGEANQKDGGTFTFVVAEATDIQSEGEDEVGLMLMSLDDAEGNIDPTSATTGTTVLVINSKDLEVPTGVILDTLPYVLMLIAVGGGVVAFFLRKRHHDDEE